MRYIIILTFMINILFAADISQPLWKSGKAFSTYLAENNIPQSLIRSIGADDLQYLAEIQADRKFYELRENGVLLHALIPVGEEMQIHLFKDYYKNRYVFDIIPITVKEIEDLVSISIKTTLNSDIDHFTKNPRLGYLLKKYYSKSVDFKKLQSGDKVSFVYRQKSRLGNPYGSPKIQASLIRTRGKDKFLYADKGGIFYNGTHKNVSYTVKKRVKTNKGKSFIAPLRKMRITSTFTYKRWHPILKRYRPHLGVDLGAKRGTKIYATHSGKVIYAGWMGGYGKVTKIRHRGGFVSLYAHQSKILVKKGQYVKRGSLIGRVGSTGRSTGPHLHFGLYKNKKAVNPMSYVWRKSIKKIKTETKNIVKKKIVAIKGAEANRNKIIKGIESSKLPYKWNRYNNLYDHIEDRKNYEKRN